MTMIDDETGEVTGGALMPAQDNSLAAQLVRAEIDTLVTTARRYPRSLAKSMKAIKELATLDEVTAEECTFALPRGGKTIEGPSIRFAEIVAQSWGNCQIGTRTTIIDKTDKFVEAEGVFVDCETNMRTVSRVRRRIVDSRGRVYNDDMILTTCNAAASIARRNAILQGVPKAAWRGAHEAARHVVIGDLETLANKRAKAIAAYQRFGMSAEQVFQLLDVKGEEEVDGDKLVTLRAIYRQVLEKETTVEELLRSIGAKTAIEVKTANPLDDGDAGPQKATQATTATAPAATATKAAPASAKAGKTAPAKEAAPNLSETPKGSSAPAPDAADDGPEPRGEAPDEPPFEPDAKADAPKAVAPPANADEYLGHLYEWLLVEDTVEGIMDRWKGERKTRNALLTPEQTDHAEKMRDDRLTEIREG